MRNLTKEEQDSLYKALDNISIDTGIQLFPEVKMYDYKKNLENLRTNLIVKFVDCKNSFEEQNYNDYLYGRIGAYEEILRCIDKVIENKIIREDV